MFRQTLTDDGNSRACFVGAGDVYVRALCTSGSGTVSLKRCPSGPKDSTDDTDGVDHNEADNYVAMGSDVTSQALAAAGTDLLEKLVTPGESYLMFSVASGSSPNIVFEIAPADGAHTLVEDKGTTPS